MSRCKSLLCSLSYTLSLGSVLSACISPVISAHESGNLGTFELSRHDCGAFKLVAKEHTGLTGNVGSFFYRTVAIDFLVDGAEIPIDTLLVTRGDGESSTTDPLVFLSSGTGTRIPHLEFAVLPNSRAVSITDDLEDVWLYISPNAFSRTQYEQIANCLGRDIQSFNEQLIPTRLKSGAQRAQIRGVVYADKQALSEMIRQNNDRRKR